MAISETAAFNCLTEILLPLNPQLVELFFFLPAVSRLKEHSYVYTGRYQIVTIVIPKWLTAMRPSLQPGSDLQLPDDGMMVIISVRESIGLWSQRRRRQRRLRRLLFYYSSHRKQGGNWKSTPAGIWHSIKIRLVCMESIRTPISDSFPLSSSSY